MRGSSTRLTGFPRIDVPVTGRDLIRQRYVAPMPKSSAGNAGGAKAARDRVAIANRRARHEYFILDTYECGIVLVGSEVKSIRDGRANVGDAYARVEAGEVWLYRLYVSPYHFARLGHGHPSRRKPLHHQS